MILVLAFLFILLPTAQSQELPATKWALNPELKLHPKANVQATKSENGFQGSYVGGDIEIHVKGTAFEDPKVAQQMSKVEFANLERLYQARGNPYEGQITDIIECDKAYKPRSFRMDIAGQKTKVLLVGANQRFLFGACVKSQIAYWVSYFNFYDTGAKMVIESRVYHKAKKPSAAEVAKLSKKLEQITRELLVVKAAQ